jgi:hypothetical protein
MKLRRRKPEPPTVYVGDHLDRLSRIPPHRHDPDERPTREDRAPQGSQLFKPPVDLPRVLKSKRER